MTLLDMQKENGKKKIHQRLAEWLCRHRRGGIARRIGELAYLVGRAYENRNFDMETNGEEWLLRQVASLGGARCLFDVGANVGDWSLRARQFLPDAAIHAFEIAPPVFAVLKDKVSHLDQLVLNPVGLSDQKGEIEIFYAEGFDYCTTAYREHLSPAYATGGVEASPDKSLRVPVIRGDDYLQDQRIDRVDVLKLDVEGMEGRVLAGFENAFRRRGIRVVQFEYNTTNIVSKFLLRDAHEFFGKFGYRVGKLYPNYVDFRDYHFRQEDFCGPNMIAAHRDDVELLRVLQPA